MIPKEDIILYIEIKEKLKSEEKYKIPEKLKNALIEWMDAHPEIEKEIPIFKESYTVKYIDKNNISNLKRFTYKDSVDTYIEAREFYGKMIEDNAKVVELWLDPNIYDSINKDGKLIIHYDKH